jgi:hypothetical protein
VDRIKPVAGNSGDVLTERAGGVYYDPRVYRPAVRQDRFDFALFRHHAKHGAVEGHPGAVLDRVLCIGDRQVVWAHQTCRGEKQRRVDVSRNSGLLFKQLFPADDLCPLQAAPFPVYQREVQHRLYKGIAEADVLTALPVLNAELFADACKHAIAEAVEAVLLGPPAEVYARMHHTVVAARRLHREVVLLFDQQHVELEARQLAGDGAPCHPAADHQHIRRFPVKRFVLYPWHTRRGGFRAGAGDIVHEADIAVRIDRHLACADDVLPFLQLAVEYEQPVFLAGHHVAAERLSQFPIYLFEA